ACLIFVIAATTHTQNLTLQANWIGILMLGDKRIFHFVSAAKKFTSKSSEKIVSYVFEKYNRTPQMKKNQIHIM
ncbi:hypothetical protein MNBD_GAMMA26-2557, partial [hydrothermal vent metagenome]